MQETVKMCTVNEEGKTIVKDIPKNLYSLYAKIGWTKYKPVVEAKPKTFSSKRK